MRKEFIPVVEAGQLRLQNHQTLLFDTKSAPSRCGRKSTGPCHEGPADRPVSILHQPLVLQRPDVRAQACRTSLVRLLPVLLMVAQPLLPLRLAHPQVCLVRHFLHLRSHFHFHSRLVDDGLLEALATQGALAGVPGLPRCPTASWAPPGSCW